MSKTFKTDPYRVKRKRHGKHLHAEHSKDCLAGGPCTLPEKPALESRDCAPVPAVCSWRAYQSFDCDHPDLFARLCRKGKRCVCRGQIKAEHKSERSKARAYVDGRWMREYEGLDGSEG